MKLLTLNTHSLLEKNYEEKLDVFIRFILREKPDVIALQEVNQSVSAANAGDARPIGFVPPLESTVPLKLDNHALRIVRRLRDSSVHCSWTYLPIKACYGQYDEGLALLSLSRWISATDVCTVSRVCDYQNWRTRKALGIQIQNRFEWFYTVHMGWWQDESEPFKYQWQALSRHLEPIRRLNRIWLMGDFNAPAEVRSQGYDLIAASGWHDSYHLARQKDDGITVAGVIDGWRDLPETPAGGMRIDHIWCSEAAPVAASRVAFSGVREPIVSDHFGVLIETNERA